MDFLNSDFYKDAARFATTGDVSFTPHHASAANAPASTGADPKSLIDPSV